MHCNIIIDFDGTIALKDTTDAILERFAKPEWQNIENLWKLGKIGSKLCMIRQIALISATENELDNFIDSFEIDPSLYSIIYFCKINNFTLSIVSDGLDRVISRVLLRLGIHNLDIFANKLIYTGNKKWNLSFPNTDSFCSAFNGTCKCNIAKKLKQSDDCATILIGDGQSDYCAAHDVDIIFAKSKLVSYCKKYKLNHKHIHNLSDVNKHFYEINYSNKGQKKIDNFLSLDKHYFNSIKDFFYA